MAAGPSLVIPDRVVTSPKNCVFRLCHSRRSDRHYHPFVHFAVAAVVVVVAYPAQHGRSCCGVEIAFPDQRRESRDWWW